MSNYFNKQYKIQFYYTDLPAFLCLYSLWTPHITSMANMIKKTNHNSSLKRPPGFATHTLVPLGILEQVEPNGQSSEIPKNPLHCWEVHTFVTHIISLGQVDESEQAAILYTKYIINWIIICFRI
jgi:hypothetical protein